MSFLDDGVCRDIVVFIKFLYRKYELEVCSLRTYSVANLAKSVTLDSHSVTFRRKATLWILKVSLSRILNHKKNSVSEILPPTLF